MNVSDYIVEYLNKKGITEFFGYQGTMIAYFIEAIFRNPNTVNHSCYNEQGAAFAAVGLAKATGKCQIAYATSGPGALNLTSGVADAYYDSTPVIFITGQLNSFEYTEIPELRQQGFQQTDVVNIMKPICKYVAFISEPEMIVSELEKAWEIATTGRKGPVVLDIPMNIQKAELDQMIKEESGLDSHKHIEKAIIDDIIDEINNAKHPVLLLGRGAACDDERISAAKKLIDKLNIPVITSLPAKNVINDSDKRSLGYIGAAYGHRAANIIAYKKTDLILSIGCSMCRRQTGNPEKFAAGAKIIRIDTDINELKRKVHKDEKEYIADALSVMNEIASCDRIIKDFTEWTDLCNSIKVRLEKYNDNCSERLPNEYMKAISKITEKAAVASVDVGQHMIWTAQSYESINGRKIVFSGGHGAMGFALPAAIGAACGMKKPTVCICGDGAFQMNIQELQWISREKLPVTIFVLNNNVLGLIKQQQDDFFGGRYCGSSEDGGFCSPDFCKIANAYGIMHYKAENITDLYNLKDKVCTDNPVLIEIKLPGNTKAYPKTYFGQEMYNQKPYIDDKLMSDILNEE